MGDIVAWNLQRKLASFLAKLRVPALDETARLVHCHKETFPNNFVCCEFYFL